MDDSVLITFMQQQTKTSASIEEKCTNSEKRLDHLVEYLREKHDKIDERLGKIEGDAKELGANKLVDRVAMIETDVRGLKTDRKSDKAFIKGMLYLVSVESAVVGWIIYHAHAVLSYFKGVK